MYNDEFCKTVCETITKEKNNLDNTSGVLGSFALGRTEAKDITGTINELIKVDPHEKELLYRVCGWHWSPCVTQNPEWSPPFFGRKGPLWEVFGIRNFDVGAKFRALFLRWSTPFLEVKKNVKVRVYNKS